MGGINGYEATKAGGGGTIGTTMEATMRVHYRITT